MVIRPASTTSNMPCESSPREDWSKDALLEISKMSSMINNRERAKLCTKSRFSRCDRLRSLSNVSSVMPMIPFIGVLTNTLR